MPIELAEVDKVLAGTGATAREKDLRAKLAKLRSQIRPTAIPKALAEQFRNASATDTAAEAVGPGRPALRSFRPTDPPTSRYVKPTAQ